MKKFLQISFIKESINLTQDITVGASDFSDATYNVRRAVIRTLNAQINGNGHKIIINGKDAGGAWLEGIAFIDTISETGALRNLIIEASLGESGADQGVAYSQIGVAAITNKGTIADCYFKAQVYAWDDVGDWAILAAGRSTGAVVYNEGTMKNIVSDIDLDMDMCPSYSENYGDQTDSWQQFAFAVFNTGKVENCLAVGGLNGNKPYWMTSALEGVEALKPVIGNKNFADENRTNSYVFETYDALLAGNAKGDSRQPRR